MTKQVEFELAHCVKNCINLDSTDENTEWDENEEWDGSEYNNSIPELQQQMNEQIERNIQKKYTFSKSPPKKRMGISMNKRGTIFHPKLDKRMSVLFAIN